MMNDSELEAGIATIICCLYMYRMKTTKKESKYFDFTDSISYVGFAALLLMAFYHAFG